MAHYALICPPFYSHVRVFEALAEALAARGHRTTFVLNAGGERLISSDGPAVVTTGPGGDLDAIIKRAARPNGPLGILRTVADTARLTDALCRDGPALLKAIGADAIVGDQMEPAAGLLAAHLGLPLVSVACALPVNAAPGVPLPFLGWPYDPSLAGLKRNRAGEKVAAFLLRRQRRTIEAWATRFGLAPRTTMEDCASPLLQISQCPAGFDFPRPPDPRFHAVGPIRKATSDEALPFGLHPKRPFVFASLGTLQGHRLDIFKTVASACRRIDAQLLVAHCGGLSEAAAYSLGADFVTDFAPQAAVLARADACVTHGGMNTVLDALQAAVPLLVIPIAFDQPGIAARVVHHGVGRMLPRRGLTSTAVAAALRPLIEKPEATAKAAWLGREIAKAGGATLAARLIEEATA
ncbi:nucleotide disphospho-sugar-binding domain-containing protein [Aureimonas glaciei]|uniref:Oleandomycin glycosyltransferase n=1 Tax=Aureimonas glaciei TaxID=1776957 RepID=A0A917DER2_9HYPH|nr:glycosyltransferase [Aureimonas glaciei]GGD32135.1 oleandomycin glycosyltransferase [Aureimonas glaciei]